MNKKKLNEVAITTNNNEYVIALDLGKFEGKAIGKRKFDVSEDIKQVKIRTKMKELNENEYIEIGENSYNLVYENKNIIVGENGVEAEDNYSTSKTTNMHKYIAYTIITRFLEPNTTNNKIQIVLACPISVLKIQGAKENYKKMIKGEGIIKIIVNGQKFEFEITDIMVKTEDSCIINTNELKNKNNIGIVGIGGLNMNYLQYINGDFVVKTSYEHGSSVLDNYIKDDLTVFLNGNIPNDNDIYMASNNGYICRKGEKVKESETIINCSKKRFLQDMNVLLAKDKIDLSNLQNLIFIGGTSIKLKNQIKELYPNIIELENEEDYQMLAVIGLYRVAFKKYCK